MADASEDTRIIWPEDWTQVLTLSDHFDPSRPLAVDIGCGKGRFLLARAASHPEINYLGIERLLPRLRKIDRNSRRRGLDNVRLLRIEAAYAIQWLLPPTSVDIAYVFFPDPWPKRRHHRRRLFNPAFLAMLHRVLKRGAELHVATDHLQYFEEIEALLDADTRLTRIPTFEPTDEERTNFEILFLNQGARIGRCSFRTTGP